MRGFLLSIVALLAISPAIAADSASNPLLRGLMNKDQAVRSGTYDSIDWKKVSKEDADRRRSVLEIIHKGGLKTSEDYYNAALIYQHGDSADEIRIAYALATVAVSLDPGNNPAKWLSAAAWDRILMRLGKPQWYGTQFVRPKGSSRWELYTIDENAVTDDERKAHGVPTVAESRKHAADMR